MEKISFCFSLKDRLEWNIGVEILPLFKNCILTLKNCLESLSVQDYEICISSWDEKEDYEALENFLYLNFNTEKIKVKNFTQEEFSRGKGRNRSFQLSTGNFIFFFDADMIFLRDKVIKDGLKSLKNNKAYFPICYSFYEDGTANWRPYGYGNCGVKREMMNDVNWLDKKTWGAEDDKFFDDLKSKYGVVRKNVEGFCHQWHPSMAPQGKGWRKNKARSLK